MRDIRKATRSDIGEILAIERASFTHPFSRKLFLTELCLSMARLHVIRQAGRVVGYIDFWKVGPEIHLINVAVDPRLRRQGIGLELMEFLLQTARREAAQEIYLDVRVSNVAAVALYRRCGFKKTGGRKKYYADGEDAVVMQLRL